MPIALGNATKIIGYVVHTRKEYVCLMELHSKVPESRLYEVVKIFTGKIYQRPPLRSSVKRALRTRDVYYINILDVKDRWVLMRIGCAPGTYIRKLCHDIGLILGVEAHMRELRRTATGPFREDETLITMHELSEAIYLWKEFDYEDLLRRAILPAEYLVSHLPKVVIRDTAVDAIAHGASLAVPGILRLHEGIEKGDLVAILTLKGEVVAVAEALMSSNEINEASKGLAFKPVRVVMKPGTYPRSWKRGESK